MFATSCPGHCVMSALPLVPFAVALSQHLYSQGPRSLRYPSPRASRHWQDHVGTGSSYERLRHASGRERPGCGAMPATKSSVPRRIGLADPHALDYLRATTMHGPCGDFARRLLLGLNSPLLDCSQCLASSTLKCGAGERILWRVRSRAAGHLGCSSRPGSLHNFP